MKLHQDELAVARRAAEWLTALEDAGPSEQREFADWLKQSPVHVREFLNATAVHRLFDRMDPDRLINVQDILAEHGNIGEGFSNVVALPLMKRPYAETSAPEVCAVTEVGQTRRHPAKNRLHWVLGMAASLGAVAVALFAWQTYAGGQIYRTAVGQQLTVALEDGSEVHMNGQSRLRVEFRDQVRNIRLLEGEALFTVHHDPQRPFRVQTGDTTIQALGTAFNVDRRASDVTVGVIEGIVQVTGPAQEPIKLSAGEESHIDPVGTVAEPAKVDIAHVAAWRERRLVFRADRLDDIATEFNRYNRVSKIRIEGDSVGQRRFTGVLNADHPESLLLLLTETDDVAVEKRGHDLIIRSRAEN